MAFELKHTASGLPVKWDASNVAYVVDPSVGNEVAGGGAAVSSALAGWSGTDGAPALSGSPGPEGGKPAVDGQNTVLLAREGFAPAGNALAVTVLSYVESTGSIVDADIVINGEYAFGVLATDSRPAAGTQPVSTEGGGSEGGDDGQGRTRFDLQHVVAHEVGHSLGLADERGDHGALMYAFTSAGDAAGRVPGTDDVDGIEQIYGGSPSAPAHAGCGASVAGSRTRPLDGWAALALVLGVGSWTVSRRRARILVPACALLATLAANASPAQSAPSALPVAADAMGTVVAAVTQDVGGVFRTTVDVVPTACRAESCPTLARVQAWGGTVGGITQQVGELPAPRLGETIAIAFESSGATPPAPPSSERSESPAVRGATLVTVRP